MSRNDWTRRVRRFRRGVGSLRRDVDDELVFHLDMTVQELVAAGMEPQQARAEANRRFGNLDRHSRSCRDIGHRLRRAARRGEIMTDLWLDLKFAFRTFSQNPTFVIVAVLTLAIGIAANATIFGMVNAIVFAPLPYADAERVAIIWTSVPARGVLVNSSSISDWADFRERSETFSDIGVHRGVQINLTGDDEPLSLQGYGVSANTFPMLGVEPVFGRGFLPAEDEPGSDPVVLLSWRLWQRLGAQRELVGGTLHLNDIEHTVLGVMPERFEYPQLQWRGDLWVPARFTTTELTERRSSRSAVMVGRLAAGATFEEAQLEITQIAEQLEQEHPETNSGYSGRVVSIQAQIAEPIRPALGVLLVTVGFVLLICCANVANLFFARSAGRQGEIAVRTALGASRVRIVRQLLTEAIVIAIAGGAVGYIGSELAGRAVVASLPDFVAETMPSVLETKADPRVMLATFGLALVAGLVFGVVPALRATRPQLQDALRAGAAGMSSDRHRNRMRAGLVIAEVAVSVVLVAGAGLMVKGFLGLAEMNPGFDPDGVLTMRLSLPEARYPDSDSRRQFYREAVAELQALPEVEVAGGTTLLPLSFSNSSGSFVIEGRPEPEQGQFPRAGLRAVTPGYMEAMRARIVAGRAILESDREDSTLVAVVNEAFVRRFFADENPIGKRFHETGNEDWLEIVGVVGDFRHSSLVEPPAPEYFYSYYQFSGRRSLSLTVRTAGDPLALVAASRTAIWSLDDGLPIDEVRTLEQMVSSALFIIRFPMRLMAVFAVAALLLAAVGLYGLMAYMVTQRSREMGIRMALGARTADVLRMVFRDGVILSGVGIVIGGVLAVLVGQVLASVLEGINGRELSIYLGVPVLLMLVTVVAGIAPARRAVRVDPVVSLRAE